MYHLAVTVTFQHICDEIANIACVTDCNSYMYIVHVWMYTFQYQKFRNSEYAVTY